MDIITDIIIYTGLQAGDPPRLTFRKQLGLPEGPGRVYTEAVPVPDAPLQERALTELQPGDEIVLGVEYDYSAPGWPSRVLAFEKTAVGEQHRTLTAA